MKRIKLFLFVILISFATATFTQSLDFRFANPNVAGSSLTFDIEIMCDVTTTYLFSAEAFIDYNTAAFGSNIASSVVFTPIGISAINFFYYGQALASDNAPDRLYISVYHLVPSVAFPAVNVPDTWIGLIQVTVPIVDANQLAGLQFNGAMMQTGQIYFVEPVPPEFSVNFPYNPVNVDNDFVFPLTGISDLIISEIADPNDIGNAKFVEIYNPASNTLLADFDHYTWFISRQANGGSWAHIQLEGSVAPGESYIIANNATDFDGNYGMSADQYSTVISGNGDDSYLLMKDDHYENAGTLVDIYGEVNVNGSGTAWEYTNSKVTRRWDYTSGNTIWAAAEWSIRQPVGSGAITTDMTPKSHRKVLSWNGSSNSDWYNKLNWIGNSIPDEAHDVVIDVIPGPTIGAGVKAYSHDVDIQATQADNK